MKLKEKLNSARGDNVAVWKVAERCISAVLA
jgi:hypothetical protein